MSEGEQFRAQFSLRVRLILEEHRIDDIDQAILAFNAGHMMPTGGWTGWGPACNREIEAFFKREERWADD